MRKRWIAGLVIVVLVACVGIFAVVMARGAGEHAAPPAKTASKQLWHCGMHPQVISDHPDDCPICHMALTLIGSDTASTSSAPAERKVLYWWDPMLGPGSISDHPGKSAMGMEMVPVYAQSAGPDVQIDPRVVQNMGVRTAVVTRGPLTKTVRAVGVLSLPEPGLHDVSLKINGWIDKLYADQEGMHIHKGDPLFEVYSPELQIAAQELISASAAVRALPAGASDVMRREGQAMVESARRKLLLWDVDEKEIDAISAASAPPRDVVFRSPATGHVEEKMIVQGSSIQPGMKLLRIADHATMWLDVQIYADQLPFIAAGQKVNATVEGAPGRTFAGTITFIYPHLDHMSRSLKVRATLDNPDFALKPGMYATADVSTEPTKDAILCPREAIIDTGSRQIVFIAESDGHFSPRKVRMGLVGDDDKAQILEGLMPGETVVTSGQFLMDVESRTIEATQKMTRAAMPTEQPQSPPTTNPMPAGMDAKPMDAKAMDATPMTATPPQTQPAMKAVEPSVPLTQVYCSMEKADWLQVGDAVRNPYLGQKMPDCGEVRNKIPAPPTGSPLALFVKAYLDVERGMDADKLDTASLKTLRSTAEQLPADTYPALKSKAVMLSDAKDLASARTQFKAISAELLKLLQQTAK